MSKTMDADPARVAERREQSGPAASCAGAWLQWAPGGDARLFRPEMLMIGATGRNTGKTELACRVIRHHAARIPIAALKVTAVVRTDGSCPRGGAGCGVCSSLAESWCVTRELDADSDKDTSKLLASGAREAYWLRVTHEALGEGAAGLLAHVPPGWPSVCESNSLSRVVEPGLFLQVRTASERTIKPSARAVADLVDRVVVSDGSGFDLPLDRVALLDGQWALQREACAVVMADTPPGPSVLASLRAQFTQVEVACVPVRAGENGGLMRALAIALTRSVHDWCLVVRAGASSVPAGTVNAMFRRRAGVEAIVAREASPCAPEPLVLVHRNLLPRIAGALLEGTASPAPSLSTLGKVRELPFSRQLPAGDSTRC